MTVGNRAALSTRIIKRVLPEIALRLCPPSDETIWAGGAWTAGTARQTPNDSDLRLRMGMARHEDFAICKNRSTLVTYWRFCRACETEAALTESKLVRVKRIMGSRTAEDKQSILIGMEEDLGECILSLPPETAIPLALTALNAKEKFNNADIKGSDTPDKIEALQCNNWEIRHYPDTNQILLSFRHTTGVWIRAVLPLKTASEIKKALELVEAPRKKKAIPRKRQN